MVNRRDKRRKEREEVRRAICAAPPSNHTRLPGNGPVDVVGRCQSGAVDSAPVAATARTATTAKLQQLCKDVEGKNTAALGVVAIRGQGGVASLDAPLSPTWLDPERAVSAKMTPALDPTGWFAQEPGVTLLAYSARLRRDKCTQALLFAGADPTVRWMNERIEWFSPVATAAAPEAEPCSASAPGQSHRSTNDATAAAADGQTRAVPEGVAQRARDLIAMYPSTYAVWVVSEVVHMRELALERPSTDGAAACELCDEPVARAPLCWGVACGHSFCESCMWSAVLADRWADQLRCPARGCRAPRPQLTARQLEAAAAAARDPPPAESKARFDTLPEHLDPTQQRASGKAPRFRAAWSLRMACGAVVGLTRPERASEVFKAAGGGNLARLAALVAAGFDSRACNEYGQSALAVAAEAGQLHAVQWLLNFGVDPNITFNDGWTTALDVAAVQGHPGVVDLLLRAGAMRSDTGSHPVAPILGAAAPTPTWQCLVPLDSAGAGAGSWMVDGGFSDAFLESLDSLYSVLPVATTAKEGCNTRRYFFDLHGHVSAEFGRVLATIPAARGCSIAYRRMRFLDYAAEGGTLPPHVDLRRTDPNTGVPSTHTFLLYLTTCVSGGQTSLLAGPDGDELAVVSPIRGRLLLFPHACWHEGRSTISVPKRLLRGELV